MRKVDQQGPAGLPPIVAYTRRLRLKGVTFSGFNLGILRGRDLTSRLTKKVGKSVISVFFKMSKKAYRCILWL